ncbi:MAG: response regulator, partial [Gammaproteobacteria bacterium]|nr:response regulator [Gammaproteobacteria bacterium]
RDYRVETYEGPAAFLHDADMNRHGCILLDVRMPEMSGLQLQDELANRQCRLPIIFMTGHGDIPMSVKAIKADAVDFIEKPFHKEVLFERIEEALEQNRADRIEWETQATIRSRYETLTQRECEVMHLLLQDPGNLSSKQIARTLGVSHRTVEQHRARIMDKMQAHSVAELVTMAYVCPPDEPVTKNPPATGAI